MTKLIRCECGFIARAGSDEEVVAAIREHMGTDHPDVLAGMDPADIYGWIEDI